MWKKFKAFINKDVGNENEVKMYAVIMRIVLLITCFYFLLCGISSLVLRLPVFAILSFAGVPVAVILFYLTYRNRTAIATVVTVLIFVSMIVIQTYLFGTNAAVSEIGFVVIMIICAIDYMRNIKLKLITVAVFLCYQVAVYTYLRDYSAYYQVSYRILGHWATINTVFFSAMIMAITLISTSDFSQMRQKLTQYNTKLRDVAGKDPLTGLFNRRSAIEYINGKIEGYNEGLYSSLTIVMADIDHFKLVNDTYGHDKGDEVLVALADIMGRFMRDKGLASRWGGEEFVLIFVDNNGDDTYAHLINLQREIAAKSFFFGGDEVKVTLTFGLAEQGSDSTIDDTIKEADEKLYIGKEKGRNIIIF